MTMLDLAGTILGFLLTCMVLSYIFGDNPLFRFSIYLLVGAAAGYAGAVALRNVIYPTLILPLFDLVGGNYSNSSWLSLVPLGLSLLLLTKLSSRFGQAGNVTMAFLVGAGAAVALAGAIVGTLFPQVQVSINQFDLASLPGDTPLNWLIDLFSRLISILGTLLTLVYFHFSTRQGSGTNASRGPFLENLAVLGRFFIAITFGAVFAGVYAAALTALIDRLNTLIEYVFSILGFFGFS